MVIYHFFWWRLQRRWHHHIFTFSVFNVNFNAIHIKHYSCSFFFKKEKRKFSWKWSFSKGKGLQRGGEQWKASSTNIKFRFITAESLILGENRNLIRINSGILKNLSISKSSVQTCSCPKSTPPSGQHRKLIDVRREDANPSWAFSPEYLYRNLDWSGPGCQHSSVCSSGSN